MSGFVSFVGSGPGDPELLTIKAVDRLRRADVILFDDLSSGPILSYASTNCEMVAVGKRAGRPSPKQHHVSRLLVDYAETGARVVRLKSGDSGLFGRLEEEQDALHDADIPYEIIPGVPSALAAAAAAGIPLTRRFSARRVQFVTGHNVDGVLPEDLNFPALADPLATTVVFMGQRTFPKFSERLFAEGLPQDTPALLAEAVSKPEQTLRFSTVSELAQDLSQEISPKPALILYGPLARRSEAVDD